MNTKLTLCSEEKKMKVQFQGYTRIVLPEGQRSTNTAYRKIWEKVGEVDQSHRVAMGSGGWTGRVIHGDDALKLLRMVGIRLKVLPTDTKEAVDEKIHQAFLKRHGSEDAANEAHGDAVMAFALLHSAAKRPVEEIAIDPIPLEEDDAEEVKGCCH
jgi:hypothetical protein